MCDAGSPGRGLPRGEALRIDNQSSIAFCILLYRYFDTIHRYSRR